MLRTDVYKRQMEVYQDAHVYDKGMIVVLEIMGRHAGWLAGASALPSEYGAGQDLIYQSETDFSMPKFIEDVNKVYNATGNCIVAVSEGIHYEDGGFVSEAKAVSYTHLDVYKRQGNDG